jgi:hypothetical protein
MRHAGHVGHARHDGRRGRRMRGPRRVEGEVQAGLHGEHRAAYAEQ